MNRLAIISIFVFGIIVGALVAPYQPSLVLVRGHSMEPSVTTGDWVIVLAVSEYTPEVGEVVVWQHPNSKHVIHRVVYADASTLITKGDSLAHPDRPIHYSQITGRPFLIIPIGKAMKWIRGER